MDMSSSLTPARSGPLDAAGIWLRDVFSRTRVSASEAYVTHVLEGRPASMSSIS